MLMILILAIVQMLSPHWWLVMAIPFCFGLLNTERGTFFLFVQYFLLVALLWGGMAAYLQWTYATLLSDKIQALTNTSPMILILAGSVVGGIAAAFAGAVGTSIRKIFAAEKAG